jgi:hypothetical protein
MGEFEITQTNLITFVSKLLYNTVKYCILFLHLNMINQFVLFRNQGTRPVTSTFLSQEIYSVTQ